jgi:hypothetical protein
MSRFILSIGTILVIATVACAASPRRFALREPYARDSDLDPVSVPCRPDPSPSDPARVRCAPATYESPWVWDQLDNSTFARTSRVLAVDVAGEAANANSLDEVADSSWFENRIGAARQALDQLALGGCTAGDMLPAPGDVPDGAWIVDHGKDNGSSLGFRIEVPGKGRYMLKADDPSAPEHASAAAVIGQAIYHAIGFHTPCEQVVYVRRSQLKLLPGLARVDNKGFAHPFDDKALDAVLATSAHRGELVRMTASKWLPGVTLGPFRYVGTRSDDPSDVVAHENRRELRGGRLLAAWLNHWDAREQNSMDVWLARDPAHTRSSPGHVRHYIMDTSDAIGQSPVARELGGRMGYSYNFDLGQVLGDFVSLGAIERPWDRAVRTPGREKFGYFSVRDFDPETWKTAYPNPAFLRMTERDAAWMARLIARFTRADLRAIAGAAQFTDAGDADYITQVLVERQRVILHRYLTRLSPLTDVQQRAGGQVCVRDLARVHGLFSPSYFHYEITQRGSAGAQQLPSTVEADSTVCFAPRSTPLASALSDGDPRRLVVLRIRNGTGAGPLDIHAYDLGARGLRIVGLERPAP